MRPAELCAPVHTPPNLALQLTAKGRVPIGLWYHLASTSSAPLALGWRPLSAAERPIPLGGGFVAGKTAQNRKLRKRLRSSQTGASAERRRRVVARLFIACAVVSLLVLGLNVEPFSSYLRACIRLDRALHSVWGIGVLLFLFLGILAEIVHRARRGSTD